MKLELCKRESRGGTRGKNANNEEKGQEKGANYGIKREEQNHKEGEVGCLEHLVGLKEKRKKDGLV